MVKYFHYRMIDASQNLIARFDGRLQSDQCREMIAGNRRRCTKRCQIGLGFCWIHLLRDKKLRYKESTLQDPSGYFIKGLFAFDKNIQPGDDTVVFDASYTICLYDSEVISNYKLTRRYKKGSAPYGARMGTIKNDKRIRHEDGALFRGVGSLINHSIDPNCQIFYYDEESPRAGRCFIGAIKNIENNEELLVDYGSDFHFNEPREKYSTNYKRLTL